MNKEIKKGKAMKNATLATDLSISTDPAVSIII